MSAHHGNTIAAWAAVALGLVAFVVGGVALMLSPVSWPMFWVGVVLLPAALVLFIVMSKMGYGSH